MVAGMLKSVFEQPDAEAVHGQYREGVCCVDPSTAVVCCRRAQRRTFLQSLFELGERSAQSITGGQFGAEFVMAAAQVLNEGMSGRNGAQ
jgi:hypothetical protein